MYTRVLRILIVTGATSTDIFQEHGYAAAGFATSSHISRSVAAVVHPPSAQVVKDVIIRHIIARDTHQPDARLFVVSPKPQSSQHGKVIARRIVIAETNVVFSGEPGQEAAGIAVNVATTKRKNA